MAKLGKELWQKIELPQGRAFISDNVGNLSDEFVLEIAAIALEWQKEGVKVLSEFLKEHTQQGAKVDEASESRCKECGRKVGKKGHILVAMVGGDLQETTAYCGAHWRKFSRQGVT